MPAASTSQGRNVHPSVPWHRHVAGPGVVVLLGAWLVIASIRWTYGDTDAWLNARWNDAVAGGLLAVVGLARLIRPVLPVATRTLAVVVGGWLVVAPFVAGYGFGADSTPATANDVLVGVVVAGLALARRI
jgi:peptidoglycan/LPS O-acetylase OafA/YrhL